MSVRRKTKNRMTIFRECLICGQRIVTTAETPWMRQMYDVDGKKQKTCYFCSTECLQASYKRIGWYDGKAEQRRAEKDRSRDPAQRAEQWQRYYAANADRLRAKRMDRYWSHHDAELESNKYQRRKRKLLEAEGA